METTPLQTFERLEDALANIETCGELTLRDLRAIPAEVGSLRQLRKLELRLTGDVPLPWPASLFELPELRELSVIGASEIPPAIAKLAKLERLVAVRGALTDLPDELGSLANLQSLDVSENKLRTVPAAITRLPKLRLLFMRNNPLTEIPEAIGELTQLEMFQCTQAPELRALPASIARLPRLECLDVGETSLASLPEELCTMPGLGRLGLRGNKLTSLPEAIGSLPKLYWLALGDNALTTLPASLVGCKTLRQIELTGNTFSDEGMAVVAALAARKGRRRVKVRPPRAAASLEQPLAEVVLAQIARLGGTVATHETKPPPKIAKLPLGEVRVPEALRQYHADVTFPDGAEFTGTVMTGWGAMTIQLPRYAELGEFACARREPYYTIAWQNVSRAYFVVNLRDHDVTNPMVFRLDTEGFDDRPLETELTLAKFLAKLRVANTRK